MSDGNIAQKYDKAKLLEKYDTVIRICALRFSNEDSFEDFVQEGMLSILEKSIKHTSADDFTTAVIRNCLRYQKRQYLNFYSDSYSVFDENSLIEKFNLNESLFGDCANDIVSDSKLTFEETHILCKSIVDKKQGQLKSVLKLLYNLE